MSATLWRYVNRSPTAGYIAYYNMSSIYRQRSRRFLAQNYTKNLLHCSIWSSVQHNHDVASCLRQNSLSLATEFFAAALRRRTTIGVIAAARGYFCASTESFQPQNLCCNDAKLHRGRSDCEGNRARLPCTFVPFVRDASAVNKHKARKTLSCVGAL